VLIKLDEQPDHTTTPSGVILPQFTPSYTESGRPKDELSSKKHLLQGTIIALSPLASTKLNEENTPLEPNDRVYISPLAHSDSYQFFANRQIAAQFEGLIAIPHSLIEAKILSNG
jgi:hypothetical protein